MCVCTCMCPICVPGACGGQRRVVASMEPELRMVGSHQVGAGNRSRGFYNNNFSELLSHLFNPDVKPKVLDLVAPMEHIINGIII